MSIVCIHYIPYVHFMYLSVYHMSIPFHLSIFLDVITLEELESLHAELMILKETVQKYDITIFTVTMTTTTLSFHSRIQLLTSEIGVLNDWQVKRKLVLYINDIFLQSTYMISLHFLIYNIVCVSQ